MNSKSLVIVGGGITGLVSALLCARGGWNVTVVEASADIGGLLATYPIGGTRLEKFYHHFFTHDAELLWLLSSLNISQKVVFHNSSMGMRSHQCNYPFNGITDLLRFEPLKFLDKIRFGLTSAFLSYVAHWQHYEQTPALTWFQRWAGAHATEIIWRPMIRLKFGEHAEQLPLAWMVGRLSQRVRSRQRGQEKLGYLQGSLQELLDAIVKELKHCGVRIICNQPIVGMTIHAKRIIALTTPDHQFTGDHFLFTIPSPILANLIMPHLPQYGQLLKQTRYMAAICCVITLPYSVSDFYWLNLADTTLPFGGLIEHTQLIPATEYNNQHILYLSRYCDPQDPIMKLSNEQILALAYKTLTAVNSHFQASDVLAGHVFRTQTAATYCDLNFSRKVPKYHMPFDNGFIANMSHIYPDERSCNNAIRVCANVCAEMGLETDHIPKGGNIAGDLGRS